MCAASTARTCASTRRARTHASRKSGRPRAGSPELRQFTAQKLKYDQDIDVDPDGIVLTAGSGEAIALPIQGGETQAPWRSRIQRLAVGQQCDRLGEQYQLSDRQQLLVLQPRSELKLDHYDTHLWGLRQRGPFFVQWNGDDPTNGQAPTSPTYPLIVTRRFRHPAMGQSGELFGDAHPVGNTTGTNSQTSSVMSVMARMFSRMPTMAMRGMVSSWVA